MIATRSHPAHSSPEEPALSAAEGGGMRKPGTEVPGRVAIAMKSRRDGTIPCKLNGLAVGFCPRMHDQFISAII